MLVDRSKGVTPATGKNRLRKAFSIEWIGQTVASFCWIGSVLTYGMNSAGDWLQLTAASAWLLANVAALLTFRS